MRYIFKLLFFRCDVSFPGGLQPSQLSSDQNPCHLLYRGDYTIQLYMDYNKPLKGSKLITQYYGMSFQGFVAVAHLVFWNLSIGCMTYRPDLAHQATDLPVCIPTDLPPTFPSVYPFIYTYIYLYIYCIYPYVCPSIYLSIYLSIHT